MKFLGKNKRPDKAKECIYKVIKVFEQCEAEVYLKHSKKALASLS